jgi:transcriptional regulator with XRE-family HTH domain
MWEPIYDAIGKRIKLFREAVGMTQQQLADICEISRTAMVNIEHGRQRVYIHHLCEIATALDVPLIAFIDDEPWERFAPRQLANAYAKRRAR